MRKQVEVLESLDLNNKQTQLYQPHTKSIKHLPPPGQSNQEAIDETACRNWAKNW